MARNIAKKLFVDRKETTGSVSSTTSMEVEPTATSSMPEEEEEEEQQQQLVSREEETAGRAVTEDVVSQKGTYSSSSLAEDSTNAAATPPTSFSPAEQHQSVAPSSKGPAADLGLLLLLATSLLVLAVSVGLVLWANIIAPEEEQFIPVRSEDLSDF